MPARRRPGDADLYLSHPDVYIVVACLKYGPVRQAFQDAALEELAGDLARTPQKLSRGRGVANPERESKPARSERQERQESRAGSPAPPAPLPPARLFRMFLSMLSALRGCERQIADWTQHYGRGRGQQPWGWLVRWNVVERCEEHDPGAQRLGGVHYRPRTPGEAAGGLAGLAALEPVVWACQLRPSGARPPGSAVPGSWAGTRAWAPLERPHWLLSGRGRVLARIGSSARRACTRRSGGASWPSHRCGAPGAPRGVMRTEGSTAWASQRTPGTPTTPQSGPCEPCCCLAPGGRAASAAAGGGRVGGQTGGGWVLVAGFPGAR